MLRLRPVSQCSSNQRAASHQQTQTRLFWTKALSTQFSEISQSTLHLSAPKSLRKSERKYSDDLSDWMRKNRSPSEGKPDAPFRMLSMVLCHFDAESERKRKQ